MLTVDRTRPPRATIEACAPAVRMTKRSEPVRKRRLVDTKPGH
jgi:hypothetical protein